MLEKERVTEYHRTILPYCDVVRTDLEASLKLFIQKAESEEVSRILGTSEFTYRVKSPESIMRKCQRDSVDAVELIPSKIEDLIGLRINVLNKRDARLLFDNLQGRMSEWFCETEEPPKFVPYTIEAGNKYSMKSGYQAFHITFMHPRQFPKFSLNARWPVEIQITTRLWHFWSEYSRRYFYRGTVDTDAPTGPYNLAISKILDLGDDLMVATTDAFLKTPPAEIRPEEPTSGEITYGLVWDWLTKNRSELIGEGTNMPNPIFIQKIVYQLNIHGISLGKLEQILRNDKLKEKYAEILTNSAVKFIPPYQKILCFILLSMGHDTEEVVSRVNEELQLLGIKLRAHAPRQ